MKETSKNVRSVALRKGAVRTSVQYAMCIAIVFVFTRLLQFPIPLGYAHLGNAAILLVSVYFGPGAGMAAGGLGSALADLTSYPIWTLPTLIIKTVMGLLCAAIAGRPEEGPSGKPGLHRWRVTIACIAATLEMIVGYTLAGALLYGSLEAGLSQVPGLTAEGVIGIAVFYPLGAALKRTGVLKKYVTV